MLNCQRDRLNKEEIFRIFLSSGDTHRNPFWCSNLTDLLILKLVMLSVRQREGLLWPNVQNLRVYQVLGLYILSALCHDTSHLSMTIKENAKALG